MARLLIVLLVLSGLVAFALQNMTPTLPIVFLGLQTPPLPLAFWILIALAAGALTALAISSLLGLANYFARETGRRSVQTTQKSSSFRVRSSNQREQRSTQSTTTPKARQRSQEDREFFGEEEEDDFLEDDFRDEDPPPPSDRRPSANPAFKTTPQPSTYSYSVDDSVNTGAGRKEAVYDAEYKVIVPPYRFVEEPQSSVAPPPSAPPNQSNNSQPKNSQPESQSSGNPSNNWDDWDDWEREFEDGERGDRNR